MGLRPSRRACPILSGIGLPAAAPILNLKSCSRFANFISCSGPQERYPVSHPWVQRLQESSVSTGLSVEVRRKSPMYLFGFLPMSLSCFVRLSGGADSCVARVQDHRGRRTNLSPSGIGVDHDATSEQ